MALKTFLLYKRAHRGCKNKIQNEKNICKPHLTGTGSRIYLKTLKTWGKKLLELCLLYFQLKPVPIFSNDVQEIYIKHSTGKRFPACAKKKNVWEGRGWWSKGNSVRFASSPVFIRAKGLEILWIDVPRRSLIH